MKYGLLIGFLLHVAGVFAQQQVVITNDFTKRVLGQELSTYNDQSGKLKLTDVLTKEFQENILARLNISNYKIYRVIYFVSYSCSKLPKRCHFFSINKLALSFLKIVKC